MERLRERITFSTAPTQPLLPKTTDAHLHARQRRPALPVSPRRGARADNAWALLSLLQSHRFLTALLAFTLLLHCVMRLPALRPLPADFSDLASLSSDGNPPTGARGRSTADDVGGGGSAGNSPKLIPLVLHQTYSSAAALPPRLRKHMQSWRVHHPSWEVRFYDDQGCLEFVRKEFPQYLDVYRELGKPIERADLFRYLVLLRHGGVFADVDAECRQPLDGLIQSRDTLVVGWDNEYSSAERALNAWSVRTRQVTQWVIAAAAGHPSLREAADRVAAAVRGRTVFSTDASIDTQERTGAGLFTDVVLAHATAHPPAQRDNPWGVRVLPRVAFGTPVQPTTGLSPTDPGVVVLHHQRGAWRRRQCRRWFWQRNCGGSGDGSADNGSSRSGGSNAEAADDAEALAAAAAQWRRPSPEEREEQLARMQRIDAEQGLYPVSASFSPPFELLTHLAGHGERQSGQDVGAALTAHGSWQPSVQPWRQPSLVDVVVGSLRGYTAGSALLVDVGAGYGLLTLAAAARGHRVVAFELGPHSLEALEGAVARNGFDHLVDLQKLPLGGPRQEGYICLQPKPSVAGVGGGGSAAAAARTDMARGYAAPSVHAVPAEACQLMAKRTPGAEVVGAEEQVGAIRVSANGWEGWVLEGFAPLIERQLPPVIALEWSAAAMRRTGYMQPLRLLQWLHGLGYTEASHSGYVCDERWYAITYGVRRRGGVSPEELAGLRQPTWCRLLPEHWSLLLERSASTAYPETLLLVNRQAGNSSRSSGHGSGAELGAVSAHGHAARGWQPGDGSGRGGAAEEAELEASVAAALAALERAEHAVLPPAKRQEHWQQQARPAAETVANSTAAVAERASSSSSGGAGGSSSSGSSSLGSSLTAAEEAVSALAAVAAASLAGTVQATGEMAAGQLQKQAQPQVQAQQQQPAGEA